MTAIVPEEGGVTHFTRCADCHRMWEPTDGPSFRENTLTVVVYWRTPPVQKVARGRSCWHVAAIESWNGKKWVRTELPQ